MSGGVDSTACAILLKEKYDVQGFFMQLAQPDYAVQKARVELIAGKLGIRLHIVDLRQQFRQHVLDYFSGSYFKGLTPNPCVICNREIKFGMFLDSILSAGMSCMATGHYARIVPEGDTFKLFCGQDPSKDQSYFLSRLSQEQLSRILFPLGHMNKEDIYNFVESHGFTDFRGRESQDVCFLENSKVGTYLDSEADSLPEAGNIVSSSGKIIGRHNGLHRYTIGQRRGLGISSDRPLYVNQIDAENNRIVVGPNEELFKKTILVKDIHWLSGNAPDISREYTVRIRYSHRGALATLSIRDEETTLEFTVPQRAITPGQFAVIYDAEQLLGSAVIVE